LKTQSAHLATLELQLDLLENLNRRMEELRLWKMEQPRHTGLIDDVSAHGSQLGESIGQMDMDGVKSRLKAQIEYIAFIRDYEALWLQIR
jgi:fructose-1,6-bisphosphatase/sedoheptulose 1,7-bisphosphatase-like protein